MTDEQFIERARAGDRDAERRLVERYAPLARQMGSRYSRHKGDRDDVVAEVLHAIVRCTRFYDPTRGVLFRPYLLRAVARAAIEAAIRQQNVSHVEVAAGDSLEPATGHLPTFDDQILDEMEMRDAASVLNSRQQQVVAHLLTSGNVSATARYFGCSRQHVYNILRIVRDRLEAHHE